MVTSKAKTVVAYLKTLDPDDREGIECFHRILKQAAEHTPKPGVGKGGVC